MAEMLTGVNGEIIKWAREYYNMTQSDAALAIGVDIGRYCNWEDGTESPTYAKLRKISEVFHKPSALFFFPEPPQLPTIKGDLRTLPDEVVDSLSRNVIRQFEKAQAYQLNLRELYGNKPSVLSRRADFPTDINELCDYFRLLLAFPIAAQKARKSAKVVFEIFREKFYELGIYVFKDAFKDNSVSGLCLNDDQYPIIIINNSMSFARQIFTLFHELYHLISNTSGAEIIRDDFYVYLNEQQTNSEKACDVFANAFLVPLSDFEEELKKQPLDEDRITDLAILYSVSKEAIMYKLLSLRKITHSDYDRLKETFYGDAIRNLTKKSGDKGGGNHYLTKLSYLGPRYAGDVFKEYFSGRISSTRASEMLNSKIDHLPKLESTFYRGVK
jgi:Zn-dependent peptidase ImmA (M78 family)/DNA-binding XRE family transcriptional regulator